jgi:uncharacterized protein
MARLPYIDADSHVEECEATWSHLEASYRDRRPIHLDLSGTPGLPRNDSYWLIDGRIHARPGMPGSTQSGSPVSSTLAKGKPFSVGSQTLEDVPERLRDMDRMGIDISVLFPTAVLTHLSPDPAFEAALMRSYNTWLAERCAAAPTRLKWGALVPFRDVPAGVAEVRRAKALGASAAFSLGTAGDKLLHHPSHDPIYAALVEHDLPLAVHVGWSHPGLLESCNDVYESFLLSFTLPVLMGFFSITGGGVLDRFPALRVAFLEAGGDWLPYMVDRMGRYYGVTQYNGRPVPRRHAREYLEDGNVYVSVEGDERLLPVVVEVIGEDQIVASADMPHPEARDECMAEIAERTDISEAAKAKILTHNPARLFGIDVAAYEAVGEAPGRG